jgi:hypothetical protein
MHKHSNIDIDWIALQLKASKSSPELIGEEGSQVATPVNNQFHRGDIFLVPVGIKFLPEPIRGV